MLKEKMYMGQKKDLKQRVLVQNKRKKKREKKRKEIKEYCVQHTKRGLDSNKFRLVKLMFIYLLPTSCSFLGLLFGFASLHFSAFHLHIIPPSSTSKAP
jgi:hypothetical protein